MFSRFSLVEFFRSGPGKGYLLFLVLTAALSAGVGSALYFSNMRSFAVNKSEEKATALRLVDAFFTSYSELLSRYLSGDAPVHATFRSHAIRRFNGGQSEVGAMRINMVGYPGRAIATLPTDEMMVAVLRDFAREADPRPSQEMFDRDRETVLRTMIPVIARQQSCVDCHNALRPDRQPWQLNDVMGAFVAEVAAKPFKATARRNAIAAGGFVFVFGAAIGFYIFYLHFRQIRRHEEASDRLRTSEERFRDYAETASDWYWESGPDHRFTYLSDRIRELGIDPAAIVGRQRESMAADGETDAAKWKAHQAQLDLHEPFRDFTYGFALPDGGTCHVSISGKPVFGSDGRVLGYRGSGRDITAHVAAQVEMRAARAQAEAAHRTKSEFLASMSHELRTPLNAIIGFSEVVGREIFGPVGNPRYRDYANDINASGQHLLALINDILDLSKVEAQKLELHDEAVDVAETAATCVRFIKPRADAANVVLHIAIPADLPRLRADKLRLRQIILNLLTNAVKFTPGPGEVRIFAGIEADGSMSIAVADTGIGMSRAEVDVALEPFRQIDNPLTRSHEGTGLGLPLVKALTTLHGGSLQIDSEKGSGTTVTIRIPAARVIADGEAPAAAAGLAYGT